MSVVAKAGRLAGKVAIITGQLNISSQQQMSTESFLGGGSGFGAAIAKQFANQGARIVVADIDEDGGKRTVEHMSKDMKFHKANVTKERDWRTLIEATQDAFGGVDCLPTLEVTESDFDKCFDVNVKGIFFSISAVIPQLLEQKRGGSIINVASIGATRPRAGLVWYNSSKGAVWNATKGLAAEFGPHGIRVNSVCPLLSRTGLFEMFSGVPDTQENRDKFLSNVPLGRLCDVTDVASACLFFASDESSFVTGINMEVDGGRAV
ncbi:hypothetical protein ACLMJK_002353 [Lecanora helva]